jgi:hypothetical protein
MALRDRQFQLWALGHRAEVALLLDGKQPSEPHSTGIWRTADKWLR